MKRYIVILTLLTFALTGCSFLGNNNAGIQDVEESITATEIPPAEVCITGEEHPIARNMAATYSEITTYEEIVGWFCQGALFEDILNALTTEELTEVDAGVTLQMLADGKTWDEIWLELGITQQ